MSGGCKCGVLCAGFRVWGVGGRVYEPPEACSRDECDPPLACESMERRPIARRCVSSGLRGRWGAGLRGQPSTINPQHSTLNTQPSTLNTQHSTLNTQPWGVRAPPSPGGVSASSPSCPFSSVGIIGPHVHAPQDGPRRYSGTPPLRACQARNGL